MRKVAPVLLVVSLILSFRPSLAAGQAADSPLGTVNVTASGLTFQPSARADGWSVRVSGPEGFAYGKDSTGGGAVTVSFSGDDQLLDGSYAYEIRPIYRLDDATRARFEAARNRGDASVADELRRLGRLPASATLQSGAFTVSGGAVVAAGAVESAGAVADAAVGDPLPPADVVHLDDVIIDGSLCVGFDCVAGESFGFDTIRLKENNLRIKFEDTSVAPFPTNDWELIANDSASGGVSRFRISDVNGGQIPFTVEAGADNHALYVEDDNDVGFGTSVPLVDLHAVDGDSPALRLEQNGSGGFAPQAWDIAGNETSFFIRDVTNGSTLPFRIRPGAPSSSLAIESSGDVGIGTISPTTPLHVRRTNGTAQLLVEEATTGAAAKRNLLELSNKGEVKFRLRNSDPANAQVWDYEVQNDRFIISRAGSGGPEFSLFNNGIIQMRPNGALNFDMDAAGNLEIGGTLTENSSRALKHRIEPISATEVLEKVVRLPITTWSYIHDPSQQRHIGPFAEEFWQEFGLGEDSTRIAPRDTAGVALVAIQGLEQRLQEMRQRDAAREQELQSLRARNAELEERLARIESLLRAKRDPR